MELLEEDGELQNWERGLSGEMTAGMALLQSLELARAPKGGSTLRCAPPPPAAIPPLGSPPTPRWGGWACRAAGGRRGADAGGGREGG